MSANRPGSGNPATGGGDSVSAGGTLPVWCQALIGVHHEGVGRIWGMPPDLQGLLDAIAAAEAEARIVVARLTDAQGNWQPGGGTGWSVAQCLDHLAISNRLYTDHFLPVVERARAGAFAGLRPTALGRWFVRSLEPPPRQRIRTFKNLMPPSSIPLAEALARYLASHEPYRRLVALAATRDCNRVVAPNPFIGWVRMRLSTALLVIPAHDRRHLWQARQVIAAVDFPRG